MSAPTTAPGDFATMADEFAARVCEHMATDGWSILLLGRSGVGKTSVERLVRADLADRIASWNECHAPPPTDKVVYLLLSTPVGVGLHYQLPPHDNGLEATVRACVHPAWLRG